MFTDQLEEKFSNLGFNIFAKGRVEPDYFPRPFFLCAHRLLVLPFVEKVDVRRVSAALQHGVVERCVLLQYLLVAGHVRFCGG